MSQNKAAINKITPNMIQLLINHYEKFDIYYGTYHTVQNGVGEKLWRIAMNHPCLVQLKHTTCMPH